MKPRLASSVVEKSQHGLTHDGAAAHRSAPCGTERGAMTDQIGTTEARAEGFYWVMLGKNPPEIAYWERGEWWLAGNATPWQPDAVTVVSERLVFRPRLTPVA